jgi:hypothetical protein
MGTVVRVHTFYPLWNPRRKVDTAPGSPVQRGDPERQALRDAFQVAGAPRSAALGLYAPRVMRENFG